MRALPDIDWSNIDTALLDMDGTLLDLRYDNVFWMDYLPQRYAEHHGMSADEAMSDLIPRFQRHRGTLQWYCVDYWSNELQMDVAALKPAVAHLIGWRPGAEALLQKLLDSGKQRWLATNAHHHSYKVKNDKLDIGARLDRVINAHDLGHPKESPHFWSELVARHAVDLSRSALLDDNIEALDRARACGVGLTIAISKPDSGMPARQVSGHPVVETLADLI